MPAYTVCQRCGFRFEVNLFHVHCPECNWPEEKKRSKKPKKSKGFFVYEVPVDGSCVDGVFKMTLPIPFSNNAEPKNIYEQAKYKQYWEQVACEAWLMAGRPRYNKIVLSMAIYFPDKRKRDPTNYAGNWAIKGLLDGMKARVMPDDNSEFVQIGSIDILFDKDNPRFEVIVNG